MLVEQLFLNAKVLLNVSITSDAFGPLLIYVLVDD